MQFSEDNSDELFKKAAEEYPLKTDSGNWDSLNARLNKNAFPRKVIQTRRWQYAAMLLLLTGTFFVINDYYNKPSNNNTSIQHPKRSSASVKEDNKTNIKPQTTNTTAVNTTTANATINKGFGSEKNSDREVVPIQNNDGGINSVVNKPMPALLTQSLANQNNPSSLNEVVPLSKESDVHVSDVHVNTDSRVVTNNSQAADIDNNSNKEQTKDIQQASTHVRLLTQPKTFYGSFFVGPQLSTVKFQHPDKLGYRIGIALGYRLSNRFNVELGVQRENKSFFSEGKYFDRSNVKLKPSTSIESLNGNAVLTDIPISVRYNFHSKKNGQFFATAGVSTVLITHSERYNYAVTKNGAPDNLTKSYGSLASTKYFSNMNVSLGYETPVGNSLRLKVEPYYQTYSQGFGVGDLPLSSFGINLGIVKDFK